MTHTYEAPALNDEDVLRSRNVRIEGGSTANADESNTSFEIDDPDDEEEENTNANSELLGVRLEVIGNALATTATTLHCRVSNSICSNKPIVNQTGFPSVLLQRIVTTESPNRLDESSSDAPTQFHQSTYTVPHVTIRTDSIDMSEEDSSSYADGEDDSQTGSSTPTTADVADVTATMQTGISSQKLHRLSPLLAQQYRTKNNGLGSLPRIHGGTLSNVAADGSLIEDNLSASIATTTTDIDVEGEPVASVSPNTKLRQHEMSKPKIELPHAFATGSANHSPHTALLQTDSRLLPALRETPKTASNTSICIPGHQRSLSSSSYRSAIMSMQSHHSPSVQMIQPKLYSWMKWFCIKSSGIGQPSVYHALVVIFLEFFAWGLLAMPVISVLNKTFPDHTFLMNGLVMGIKGIFSFLSAPLIGALSDIWGRKFFLLITVFFTCAPIPLMTINSWWFFAMISISGVFAVTFSVVFAYVADVTTVEERSRAYGLVSATFAASLVISPALGAALMEMYSDTLVVALATAIAVLDVFFILVAVPESLPEKMRASTWGNSISWEQADPFAALRKVGTDHTVLMQCVTVLLSYLPEAGQYSCIFVYLKLKMGFNSMDVAIFIAVVGILSISVQVILGYLMRVVGAKRTILLGLVLEMLQLLWYGFGNQAWMMWSAGILAALGSITYPAISAFVSIHSTADRQGAVQGMVTGMRGLCNGLGPAMFGVIFYLFNVDLTDESALVGETVHKKDSNSSSAKFTSMVPGPPFVFGAFMVIIAILVAVLIPDARPEPTISRAPSEKKRASVDVHYEVESGHHHKSSVSQLAPLMRSDSMAQL